MKKTFLSRSTGTFLNIRLKGQCCGVRGGPHDSGHFPGKKYPGKHKLLRSREKPKEESERKSPERQAGTWRCHGDIARPWSTCHMLHGKSLHWIWQTEATGDLQPSSSGGAVRTTAGCTGLRQESRVRGVTRGGHRGFKAEERGQ